MPTKDQLRKDALEKRLSFSGGACSRAAQDVSRNFFKNVHFHEGLVVAGYWPVRGELDVLPLLREVNRQGGIAALPCVDQQSESLVFRVWGERTSLRTGAYGIMEPEASSPSVIPDVVLVPLLAFDDAGNRLGYGAGYYDRALQRLRAEKGGLIAVGAAFSFQRVPQVPADPHDYRLDMVITDEEERKEIGL